MSECEWSAGDFYSEYFPVARKTHRCCECTAPINKAERHLRASGKSDQTIWDARQHMLCRDLCMLMNAEGDGCCAFGNMDDEWREGDWRLGLGSKDLEINRRARVLRIGIIRREVKSREAARPPKTDAP